MSNMTIQERGCGFPKEGGTYLEIGLEENGVSIWYYAVCSTIPVDPELIGLTGVSMAVIQRPGTEIFDLYDWIGEDGYPNPFDWLLEVGHLGFHQKVNPQHLLKLSRESLYFPIHRHASFVDPRPVWKSQHTDSPLSDCPHALPTHKPGPKLMHNETCLALLYENVLQGEVVNPKLYPPDYVVRKMPSFEWKGFKSEKKLKTQPAIFARLPIGVLARILVYKDHSGNHKDQAALDILANLPDDMKRVELVEL